MPNPHQEKRTKVKRTNADLRADDFKRDFARIQPRPHRKESTRESLDTRINSRITAHLPEDTRPCDIARACDGKARASDWVQVTPKWAKPKVASATNRDRKDTSRQWEKTTVAISEIRRDNASRAIRSTLPTAETFRKITR